MTKYYQLNSFKAFLFDGIRWLLFSRGLFNWPNQDDQMNMTDLWQRQTLFFEFDRNWNRQTLYWWDSTLYKLVLSWKLFLFSLYGKITLPFCSNFALIAIPQPTALCLHTDGHDRANRRIKFFKKGKKKKTPPIQIRCTILNCPCASFSAKLNWKIIDKIFNE